MHDNDKDNNNNKDNDNNKDKDNNKDNDIDSANDNNKDDSGICNSFHRVSLLLKFLFEDISRQQRSVMTLSRSSLNMTCIVAAYR